MISSNGLRRQRSGRNALSSRPFVSLRHILPLLSVFPDHPGAGPDGIDPVGTLRSMSRMGMEMIAGRGTINIKSMIVLERLCGHHEKSREEMCIKSNFFNGYQRWWPTPLSLCGAASCPLSFLRCPPHRPYSGPEPSS